MSSTSAETLLRRDKVAFSGGRVLKWGQCISLGEENDKLFQYLSLCGKTMTSFY